MYFGFSILKDIFTYEKFICTIPYLEWFLGTILIFHHIMLVGIWKHGVAESIKKTKSRFFHLPCSCVFFCYTCSYVSFIM